MQEERKINISVRIRSQICSCIFASRCQNDDEIMYKSGYIFPTSISFNSNRQMVWDDACFRLLDISCMIIVPYLTRKRGLWNVVKLFGQSPYNLQMCSAKSN